MGSEEKSGGGGFWRTLKHLIGAPAPKPIGHPTTAELKALYHAAIEEATARRHIDPNPQTPQMVAEAIFGVAADVAAECRAPGGPAMWAAVALIRASESPAAALANLRIVLAKMRIEGDLLNPMIVPPSDEQIAATMPGAPPPAATKPTVEDRDGQRVYSKGTRHFAVIDGGQTPQRAPRPPEDEQP